MNGQWIGTYSGTNIGQLIVELDDMGSHYHGTVYAIETQHGVPPIAGALINVPKGQPNFKLRIPFNVVERETGNAISQEDLAKLFPGVTWSPYADSEWSVGTDTIHVKWQTPAGTNGSGTVERKSLRASELKAEHSLNWRQFKDYAATLDPERFLFRGQEDSRWPIQTSFHRTGRAALQTFAERDVGALHRNLSGLTTHRFDLKNELDYAAFLHLVQHHGYPTPLLDWTYSPFIAAYFAFRNLRKDASSHHVRIFVFDGRQWSLDWVRARVICPIYLHLTILEPLAINNPRVVPQQSVSIVTNVEDIEAYVFAREKAANKTYLRAIDVPASEYRVALRELGLMGINAGSLFPGLDGACHQLRERFFDF